MPITRRGFIRKTLALGPVAMTVYFDPFDAGFAWADGQCGLPDPDADCTLPDPGEATRFVPAEPKVEPRFSAREMADPAMAQQLALFRKAICAVRDLPPADVIGWSKLVALHCVHCARTDPKNVHYDWQFLPWHRALLYFLERHLRKLSGSDDLRLVYWDWESPQSRTLPDIYAPPDQPLYWANRKLDGPRWPLTDANVNVQPSLATPDFDTFGGTAVQNEPRPIAYSGPHAPVHNAFSPGDMSDLQYSPRDPVFYAHHSNVDRLWSSWVAADSKHENPDFGDAKVYFYDENRKWRYVLMNDLRDESKLGYEYSSLMKAKVAPATLRESALAMTANRVSMAAETLERVQDAGPDFLFLQNVQGLDKLPADAVSFGVFTTRPEVGADSDDHPGFLGAFHRVLSAGHPDSGPLSAALEVTGKLGPQAAKTRALELLVAPLDADGKTSAEAIPLVAEKVSVVA